MRNRYRQDLGRKGEDIAEGFLRRRGCKIIVRNFSCRSGEIDIIAGQGNTTVFIEVKTRCSDEFGLPEESLTPDKISRLRRSAQFYIKNHADPEGNFRFDVISITLRDNYEIRLIEDAF
ncbi:MAG: YraN family protein [Candidatus Omnitrophica bacterium]|nr:YraN family protein [Candidatus Omnitrophota bacterium]